MRTTVAIVATLVVLATVIGAQNQVTGDAETAKIVIQNERALYDAIAKGDKAAYQALVLSKGTWSTSTGSVAMGSLAENLSAFDLPTIGRLRRSCWHRRCGRRAAESGSRFNIGRRSRRRRA